MNQLLQANDASGLLNAAASPMTAFVRALVCLLDRRPTTGIDLTHVPQTYRTLLNDWDGEVHLLAERLTGACHTRADWAAEESNVTPEGPLSDIVYAAWPVELLALLRVRQAHSMAPVVTEHPLMTAPLGALADFSRVEPTDPALLGFARRHPELLLEP